MVWKTLDKGNVKRRGRTDDWICANQGEIVFPYKDIMKIFDVTDGAVRNMIDSLIRVGLLDIAHSGLGLAKDPTLYAISDRWELYGQDEFVVMKRPKCKRGFGFQRGNTLGKYSGKRKS